jgi:hypothetical protein
MTESTDRSQAWKSEAEVDIPLDGGRVVTVLKPDAQVFVNAGMDPLCFNVMVPEKKRGQKLRAELEKIQKEGDDRLHQFMTDILAAKDREGASLPKDIWGDVVKAMIKGVRLGR